MARAHHAWVVTQVQLLHKLWRFLHGILLEIRFYNCLQLVASFSFNIVLQIWQQIFFV